MIALAKRWMTLFQPYASEPWRQNTLSDLLEHYQEPHRHYHNLQHIQECLAQLESVFSWLEDPVAVEIALWFHDAIYDPKAHDNELQSSKYASECLQQTALPQTMIDQVVYFILLTQHPAQPCTRDEQFLIDIDLSILGATHSRFAAYEKAIRQEYQHVPLLLYRLARHKLLRQFVEAERLFNTDYFHQKYAEQAHINLTWALKELA